MVRYDLLKLGFVLTGDKWINGSFTYLTDKQVLSVVTRGKIRTMYMKHEYIHLMDLDKIKWGCENLYGYYVAFHDRSFYDKYSLLSMFYFNPGKYIRVYIHDKNTYYHVSCTDIKPSTSDIKIRQFTEDQCFDQFYKLLKDDI